MNSPCVTMLRFKRAEGSFLYTEVRSRVYIVRSLPGAVNIRAGTCCKLACCPIANGAPRMVFDGFAGRAAASVSLVAALRMRDLNREPLAICHGGRSSGLG